MLLSSSDDGACFCTRIILRHLGSTNSYESGLEYGSSQELLPVSVGPTQLSPPVVLIFFHYIAIYVVMGKMLSKKTK